MFKRIGAFVLLLGITFGVVFSTTPATEVYAEEKVFGGYYEQMYHSATLDAGEVLDGVESATVTYTDANQEQASFTVDATVSGSTVTLGSFGETNENTLILGDYYTLIINGKEIQFQYVTKAIYDKDDIGVLKIVDNVTPVTGYYVLANDLKLANGEENQYGGLTGNHDNTGFVWNTAGFTGTFDGKGHNIEFYANRGGFFGVLGKGGVIKNTGFVNVKFTTPGLNPVLFELSSSTGGDGNRARVENVYIRTAEGQIPEGGISVSGNVTLILKNIVLDFPGLNIDRNTDDLSVGALWGADLAWWNTVDNKHVPNTFTPTHENVYVIGRIPVMHYYWKVTNGRKGYYYDGDGTLRRYWMEGYAENDGMDEDVYGGVKVYSGVRRYATAALMAEDDANDYSSFDKNYWGIEKFGVPVWLNGVEDSYGFWVETDAEKTSAVIYLDLGGVTTARFGYGINGISVKGASLQIEYINGAECVSFNNETGVLTAVQEGMSQFNVKCTYEGKVSTRKYTVYVENTSTNDDLSGCGTVVFTGGSIGGGGLMVLGALAFMLVRKNRRSATREG